MTSGNPSLGTSCHTNPLRQIQTNADNPFRQNLTDTFALPDRKLHIFADRRLCSYAACLWCTRITSAMNIEKAKRKGERWETGHEPRGVRLLLGSEKRCNVVDDSLSALSRRPFLCKTNPDNRGRTSDIKIGRIPICCSVRPAIFLIRSELKMSVSFNYRYRLLVNDSCVNNGSTACR